MNKFILLLVASVFISSVSQILLKKGAMKEHKTILEEYLNLFVISGYGLLVISTILTVMAFTGMEYKNGPVTESLGYLFVMLLSSLFLKEKITKKKLLGNMIIITGVLVFYL